jgi:hypothetical protein
MRATTLALLFVVLHASSALAQPRAGVPVEALTPPGMHLDDVRVPDRSDMPTRLVFVRDGQGRSQIVMSVSVTESQSRAASLLGWQRETASGELAALPALTVGDVAFAADGFIAFARHNVCITLRQVRGADDLPAMARQLAAAIDAAPTGSPDGSIRASLPSNTSRAVPAALVFHGDVLAAHVRVIGAATVRRDSAGRWLLTRTGNGPILVSVHALDRRLRWSETTLR